MPTYAYVCEKCGHEFEVVQSISAKPLTVCPEKQCARKQWARGKVKRAITGGGGLIFKGSGFYVTDYRSEKYKQAAKNDTAPAAAPAAAPTGGTGKAGGESKPASKPEVKPASTAKT